jgi:hypothetical protein
MASAARRSPSWCVRTEFFARSWTAVRRAAATRISTSCSAFVSNDCIHHRACAHPPLRLSLRHNGFEDQARMGRTRHGRQPPSLGDGFEDLTRHADATRYRRWRLTPALASRGHGRLLPASATRNARSLRRVAGNSTRPALRVWLSG